MGGSSLFKGGAKALAHEGAEQLVKSSVKAAIVPVALKEGASVAETTTKGWIKKDLYRRLTTISPQLTEAAEKALGKGSVLRSQGVSGIKELKGIGIDGFKFELKLKGTFGNYRLLGNKEIWTNQKGVEETIIIFRDFFTK